MFLQPLQCWTCLQAVGWNNNGCFIAIDQTLTQVGLPKFIEAIHSKEECVGKVGFEIE